ncbi:hypothetical protein CA13_22720 [Planctomycetes bacterium CA13]|uniref:Uncharacterized protein n=1 Tax=Novipirellula herctigrandis TaxID=2527986 RepID=A0A5C5Z1B1_9BACT|nr:hypothetical protein CA13_22720 [Planctomycetes bacterium CA13]
MGSQVFFLAGPTDGRSNASQSPWGILPRRGELPREDTLSTAKNTANSDFFAYGTRCAFRSTPAIEGLVSTQVCDNPTHPRSRGAETDLRAFRGGATWKVRRIWHCKMPSPKTRSSPLPLPREGEVTCVDTNAIEERGSSPLNRLNTKDSTFHFP